jgi:hypothetical protein
MIARFAATVILLTLLIVLFVYLLPSPHRTLSQRSGQEAGEAHESRVGGSFLYPRSDLTPGALDPRVTQENIESTICSHGYTQAVRPSRGLAYHLKVRVMTLYGVNGATSDYELDHFIPLELGGCPDCVSNLWPEPWGPVGAREKDVVENYLRRRVCAGEMSLREAQRDISSDWVRIYQGSSSSGRLVSHRRESNGVTAR